MEETNMYIQYGNKIEEILEALRNLDKNKLKNLWANISEKIPKEFTGDDSNDRFIYFIKSEIDVDEFLDIYTYYNVEFDCIFGESHKAKIYITSKGKVHIYECLDSSNRCECRKNITLGRYDIIRLISSYTRTTPIDTVKFLKEVFEVECNISTITGEKIPNENYRVNKFYFEYEEYFDR